MFYKSSWFAELNRINYIFQELNLNICDVETLINHFVN